MSKMFDVFAAGRLTAKDELIRAIADAVFAAGADVDKVCTVRGLLRDANAGAAERARGFDLEVE